MVSKNMNWRENHPHWKKDGGYVPHQGKKEMARRVKQMEKQEE